MPNEIDVMRAKLNALNVRAQKAGYTPRTQIVAIQEVAPSLVVPNNLANAGKILSRTEINQYRLSKYGQNAELLTNEQYNAMFQNLVSAIGVFTTLQAYRTDFYARAQDTINSMREYMEEYTGEEAPNISLYRLSKADIRDLFKVAKAVSGTRGQSGYTNFYVTLAETIELAKSDENGWDGIREMAKAL